MSSFRLLELALTSRQPRMSWRNSIGGLMILSIAAQSMKTGWTIWSSGSGAAEAGVSSEEDASPPLS